MDNAPAGVDLRGASFRRILLIKPSSLGDVVHALPVLHGLRRRFPSATLDWLISTSCMPLLVGHPEIDHLVEFDRKKFGRLARSVAATVEFGRFLRSLRASRYDLVIDLQGLFRTGFLARATGAGVRVGFADAREGAWAFYNHRIPADSQDVHAIDRNYRVAAMLGFDDLPVAFDLALGAAPHAAVGALLSERGLDPHREELVLMAPGARWETKRWLPDRFAVAIDALHAQPGVRCILVGGPDEVPLCQDIAQLCQVAPVNLAGRTQAPELAALIALADVVLCQDSAAMHLAVALNRPLVCLVGPTNPHRTGPYRRMEDVLRLDLECSPCYLRRLPQCRHEHRCMRDLGVDRVVAALVERLGSKTRVSTF